MVKINSTHRVDTITYFNVYKNTRKNKPILCKGLEFNKKKYLKASCFYKYFDNKINTSLYDSEFSNLLKQQGINFERDIINYIDKNIHPVKILYYSNKLDHKDLILQTVNSINQGFPFISNVYVRNKYNSTYGYIDLLVRNDYIHLLNKNISNIINKDFKEGDKYFYIAIDIKFSTLTLNSQGIYLLNNNKTRYYKSQLYIYTKALSYIQNYYCNYACVIGRKYNYINNNETIKINNCFDKMGLIDFNNNDSFVRNINNKISNKERYSEILDLCKLDLCKNDLCNDSYIYSTNYRLKYNMSDDINILPLKINTNIYDWRNIKNKDYFIDFETFPDIIHNESNIPNHNSSELIYFIGVGYYTDDSNLKYVYFKCNSLTINEENRILNEFIDFINIDTNVKCWYWFAEENILNRAIIRHKLHEKYNRLFLCDLSKIFRNEPIYIRNCNSYGLKEVINSLSKLFPDYINIKNESKCKSGTNSILFSYKLFEKLGQGDTSGEEYLDEIIKYNKFDVYSLAEILNFLRNKL